MVAIQVPIKHDFVQNTHNDLPFCQCGVAKDLHQDYYSNQSTMNEHQLKAEAYVRQHLPELTKPAEHDGDTGYYLPIHLQHWLRVLPDHGRFDDFYWEYGDDVVIRFDKVTGAPATEADYKAFNELVGI